MGRLITSREILRILAYVVVYGALSALLTFMSNAGDYLSLASKALGGLALGFALHNTYVRTKLNDAEDADYLSQSEARRLRLILMERRGHLMLLTSFYLGLAVFNFAAAWLAHITEAAWPIATIGLTLNLMALTAALYSQREALEAEDFKSKLIQRHKDRAARQASLHHLNGGHT